MSMYFKKNIKGRDFVIGDLHGCYDLFDSTMKDINFNKDIDRMFSVGDLIDRGDKNIECLRLVKEDWFYPVIGNHDEFLIKSILKNEDSYLWCMNGGGWHFKENEKELMELANIVKGKPYSMMIESDCGLIGISHAQPPSLNWSDAENPNDLAINNMIWGRSWIKKIDAKNATGVFLSIHGHTIIDKPKKVANALFIDTGAFHTGVLTCIDINKITPFMY